MEQLVSQAGGEPGGVVVAPVLVLEVLLARMVSVVVPAAAGPVAVVVMPDTVVVMPDTVVVVSAAVVAVSAAVVVVPAEVLVEVGVVAATAVHVGRSNS